MKKLPAKNQYLVYCNVILILTALILRLALPGIVKNYVNEKLNELPGIYWSCRRY